MPYIPALAHHTTCGELTRAHILIVEDEFLIAEEIRSQLVRMNYEVVGIVDSGEEAVQLAKALRPDLILMDGTLKGRMDGFEAGHLIGQYLGCPIIYITANARARDMPYRVEKPFTAVMLASAVGQALAMDPTG